MWSLLQQTRVYMHKCIEVGTTDDRTAMRIGATYLVIASVLAANPILTVGLGGVKVEDKHQVPSLTHYHFISLILHAHMQPQASTIL